MDRLKGLALLPLLIFSLSFLLGIVFTSLLALKTWIWLLFAALVGINLIQSAFTHWCLIEKTLEKFGIRRYYRFDEGDID